MKIYTRTGDDGTTGLFGGRRVSKDDTRVEAYGCVDSTNSAIGAAAAATSGSGVELLRVVQERLFSLGAEVACIPSKRASLAMRGVDASDVDRLEHEMDEMTSRLPPLKSFILPGGSTAAAALHVARTTCRQAERRLIALHRAEPLRAEVLQYVNRLSDLLFLMAREANVAAGVADVEWAPRSEK